ncbi:class I SAM-dependent methyltransferase [Synoicihabitans lomoniglobus]|uniref:SAM-dependent methyltransferase n=1 Tax=Synoicihabitans lomoniglobus TaxID=2909285 RepID=A0AAF0CR77_9BACT|nr:SAM-dependent methyltransferase [Opitutaceae bacterium LMO-M01]WED66594.1 SAM-dependent methyltransferase [Opitutaceae bacterium LMO-M01]
MPQPLPRDRFMTALRHAVADQTLTKLTLGKYRGSDPTVKNVFVRPVSLQAGPHLSFVWRHTHRDVTKNHPCAEGLAAIDRLLGVDFLDAHLFTPAQTGQLETTADGRVRVKFKLADAAPPVAEARHDHAKHRLIDPFALWLRDLGVTNAQGQPRTGLAPKFRQIQKFAEILQHLLGTAGLAADADGEAPRPLRLADMGSGKGYLTFATADLLGPRAQVTGIERRRELVDTCNRVARDRGLEHLSFKSGDIDVGGTNLGPLEVLIALHACDTATDDALAAGIAAGASLLVVSPCCQKELRPQLQAPPVLAPALRHGIFQERQAEFVTDALRALLLEAAGFETKVFEFISTEHTAKNLMLAAWHPPGTTRTSRPAAIKRAREFAAFYGIKTQALARHLGIDLAG